MMEEWDMRIKKVFIVDSDPLYREKLHCYLERNEHIDIIAFDSAEECLEYLETIPDLIILDYHLDSDFQKTMSGYELLRYAHRSFPEIKVVMLSSFDNHEEDMNSARYGAFDYIPKTESNLSRIENTIINAFQYHQLEQEIQLNRKGLYLSLAVVILLGIGGLSFMVH
ncbi:MAG: response regulator transcription factor [Chitinophagales bacterium]|nr:response regulator transcription factor [Chitinophagales bacterium]